MTALIPRTLGVGDSFFVMLVPLAVGQHTLQLIGQSSTPSSLGEVTYHLTIGR